MSAIGSPPLISILLPVFDAAATLPACLRSIQRQTEARWECVLVNDGSTDATAAIMHDAVFCDRRFRVVTPHSGLVAALRAGLGHCGGKYIARMDADDVMHRRLDAQLPSRSLRDSPPPVSGF